MVGKNDQNFIAFCDELRAYVLEKRYFPNKHTRLSNKIKFIRRKINHSGDEEYERAYRRAKEVRCRMISKGILRLFISI